MLRHLACSRAAVPCRRKNPSRSPWSSKRLPSPNQSLSRWSTKCLQLHRSHSLSRWSTKCLQLHRSHSLSRWSTKCLQPHQSPSLSLWSTKCLQPHQSQSRWWTGSRARSLQLLCHPPLHQSLLQSGTGPTQPGPRKKPLAPVSPSQLHRSHSLSRWSTKCLPPRPNQSLNLWSTKRLQLHQSQSR